MSEKWILVPTVATNRMCDAGEGFNIRCGCPDCDLTAWDKVAEGYSAMLSAVPPIPEPVLVEMVERGARALALEAGEEEWPAKPEFYRFQASSCLRAALGLDRAAANEGEG